MDQANWLVFFVNSPPGLMVAGGVIAGLVWKVFERLQAVASPDTNLRLAIWLLDRTRPNGLALWPQSLSEIFDKVFGKRILSHRSFERSALLTCTILVPISLYFWVRYEAPVLVMVILIPLQIIGNVIPDYLSLIVCRIAVRFIQTHRSLLAALLVVVGVAVLCYVFAILGMLLGWYLGWYILRSHSAGPTMMMGSNAGALVSAGLGLIWLISFVSAGAAIRLANRSGPIIGQFNRWFDIEGKPIQSIGLVAGVLLAICYWAFCFAQMMFS